jgi:hypothetical protein
MFANVLKKFFTGRSVYENKEATILTASRKTDMMTELKAVFARSAGTMVQDLAGVTALMVILVAALHLPGLA